MIMISENARLSEKCTNHCLRVTRINVLRRIDIEDSGIHSVSRHKTIDCMRPYCMTMVTMIATWRSIFQSIVHSFIIACHRLQACTSYAILACHKWMPPAVPKHPLFTGSLDMRQWALVTMTGGGVVSPSHASETAGNKTLVVVVSSQGEHKMLKSIFTGAVFEIGSAPVFDFNGKSNLFEWTFCRMCDFNLFVSSID